MADLIEPTERGLYCRAGDFYIDPWRPVDRAVVTHAHSDHARPNCGAYLTAEDGLVLIRLRTNSDAVEALAYKEPRSIRGVRVSFHPAGHILGSAQVRVEHRGEVWVVTGDYKTDPDPTCRPFEPIACHTLVTESTFALPIYRWADSHTVFDAINEWWRRNAADGRPTMLFGYALGKAQRLVAGLDPSIGPIFVHGSVARLNDAYRAQDVSLPPTPVATTANRSDWKGAMIVAPQHANGSVWMRRFGNVATGFASGWMTIRGRRRQASVDRGFVLSDHVDWPALLDVISTTGARRVIATHGYNEVLARYLREQGLEAVALRTEFRGEDDRSEVELTGEAGEGEAGEGEPRK